MDQLNGLISSEHLRIAREVADAENLHAVRLVVRNQAPHLANDVRLHLPRAPLLALDEIFAAVVAQNQVDLPSAPPRPVSATA